MNKTTNLVILAASALVLVVGVSVGLLIGLTAGNGNAVELGEGSEAAAVEAQLRAFETQLELYAYDIGNYPSTSQGLQALREAPSDLPDMSLWQGPYAKNDIPDDPWGSSYTYTLEGDWFHIRSLGPDRKRDTDDDIILGGTH